MKSSFCFVLFLLLCCLDSSGKNNQPINNQVEYQDVSVQEFRVYIGTYTNGGSEGIYMSTFNTKTGTLSVPELVAKLADPSFQCISEDHKLLFSTSESGGGTIAGFLIDATTGNLNHTETFSSMGKGTCFVNFDDKTSSVVAANYSSGNVTMIPVTADGTANGEAFTHQHTGKGPNTGRQEGPHAHCAKVDRTGKFIYSCDLGTDKIYGYTVSGDSLVLFKTIATAPGAGPRHVAFHPQLTSMAVVNELNGTVVTYLPDESGCFSIENNIISTLPDGFNGQNKCADIHYSNDGNFLYASNRGHNSIVAYSIDKLTQKAMLVGWHSEKLINTRNFALDPSGKFLLAANQDGNNITVYEINLTTGELRYTGISQTISKPVCLTFLPINKGK